MQRHLLILVLFALLPDTAQAGEWWQCGLNMLKGHHSADPAALSSTDIAHGLREALRVGTGNVVTHLGREDGFYNDPRAHIPLPQNLEKIRGTLATVGMSSMLDDLELRMNRAAELAAPKAKTLFMDAIQQMTVADARQIYEGPEDAATRYFQRQMSVPLAGEFKPIVDNALAEAGAVQSYDRVMSRYQQIPLVPDLKADLSNHVVNYGITAIFDYLALEEAAIRANPARRTTEILRRVFGS